MNATAIHRITAQQVEALDPYVFMAVVGKRVIRPGGRRSTEALLEKTDFRPDQHVLDVGCGVGTTAIELARRFSVRVTALDISPLMIERAARNVVSSTVGDHVTVTTGDITQIQYPDGSFDRVLAEAVTMFVDRARAAREMVRVCRPGGRVLASEFLWRQTPSSEARALFFGEICPGMTFDTLDDWISVYRRAGLVDVEASTGPFEMMTPAGFLADEGMVNSLAVMGRTLSRPAYLKKMIWLMSRMQRVVPYLGYVTITGTKPG